MREIRTVDEIAARVQSPLRDDVFQFERQVQMQHLPWEHAKPFLKPNVTETMWSGVYAPLTEELVLDAMKDYLPFAWEKALNHRGLSASRSVQKFRAWLWLLGDEEMEAFARDDANYAQYGVPILHKISTHFWVTLIPDHPRVDRMRVGLVCEPGCVQGCIDLTNTEGTH